MKNRFSSELLENGIGIIKFSIEFDLQKEISINKNISSVECKLESFLKYQ